MGCERSMSLSPTLSLSGNCRTASTSGCATSTPSFPALRSPTKMTVQPVIETPPAQVRCGDVGVEATQLERYSLPKGWVLEEVLSDSACIGTWETQLVGLIASHPRGDR